jgi:hypothetical protein
MEPHAGIDERRPYRRGERGDLGIGRHAHRRFSAGCTQ